jgi:DNA-binding NtrC family response regulator
VGTDRTNGLVLSDSSVSRHHCEINASEEGALLVDLESTNGTTLNGFRIREVFLENEALFTVGESEIRFEVCDEEVRLPISEQQKFGRILGASPAMRRIFAVLERIAESSSSVLLEGETGTGKTLIAEAIHRRSTRADGPFIVLDCSAIPPTLIESELFGHEKGSFTGAQAQRIGAFEAAEGGTIFLDEIGELRLDLQPKLLRALEDRVIQRVGSQTPIKLDIRLVAATNRDLRREVNEGNFRSDLFYRLNTVTLRVPPLRERREDLSLLIVHFYRQFAGDDDASPPIDLMKAFLRHRWPGNVRELRSAVERAVLLGDPGLWNELSEGGGPNDGRAEQYGVFNPGLSYREAKDRLIGGFERWFLTELLKRNKGNLSRSARAARMDRNHLRDLVRRHHIDVPKD